MITFKKNMIVCCIVGALLHSACTNDDCSSFKKENKQLQEEVERLKNQSEQMNEQYIIATRERDSLENIMELIKQELSNLSL